MKLAPLLLGILLATTGTAAADEVLHPPGGPVYVSDPPPAVHVQHADLDRPAPRRGERGERGDRADRKQRARQLRRALVETFDANGDGRLGPRERMRAARVLRRIERRLAAGAQDPRGPAAARGALRRYDRDGDRDGRVEPGEYR